MNESGLTKDTKKRKKDAFFDFIRSPFTLLVSIVIAFSGYDMTDSNVALFYYLLYPALILLVISSTINLLNCSTAYFEVLSTATAELATWQLLEKDIYANSALFETRLGRNLCVVRNKKIENNKPVFLFVHGSMARLSAYASLMKMANEKGYNYVTYDFFGMGRSPKPNDPTAYTTESLLLDLLSVYEDTCKTYPKNPIIVVGHSYGCSLSLKLSMILKDPLEDTGSLPLPNALILIGAYRWDCTSAKAKYMRRLFSLPIWILRIIRPLLSSGFKTRAYAPETINDPAMKHVMDYATAVSGANLFHVVQPFYISSGSQLIKISELEQFKAPTTYFITGEHDKLAVLNEAEQLSVLLGASSKGVTVIKATGHQVMEEQPSQVFDILVQAGDDVQNL